MAILTLENLDPGSFPYISYTIFQSGRVDYYQKRVHVSAFDGQSATCQVNDEARVFTVSLSAETKQQIHAYCDCGQASKGAICKHIVASLFAARDYIAQEGGNHWQYRLMQALESTPKEKAARALRTRFAIVMGLLRERYADDTYNFRLVPYFIKSQKWSGVEELARLPDQVERNKKLEKDRTWAVAVESAYRTLDHRAVVNMPAEGVHLFNLMLKIGGFFASSSGFATYLPLMAKMDVPVFLMTSHNFFKTRLQLLTEPVKVEAALARDGAAYSLQAGVDLFGETFTTIKGSLQIVTSDPAWVLAGHYLVPVENPEALKFLSYLPLTIPAGGEQEFRSRFLHPIVERLPLHGDVVTWTDVDTNPVPRLYLSDDKGALRAVLKFGYDAYEVDVDAKTGSFTMQDVSNSWGMVRIHRRWIEEDRYYQLLTDVRFGLKRSTKLHQVGGFELRSRMHPFDFLIHAIPRLVEAGFVVYGEESLKTARVNRYAPTISLNISSGVDWFDVNAEVHFGDQKVDLQAVRRALRKKERYVKLADGSVGQIPDDWLERYKKLFDLAEETETGLRVRDYHLPLVDTLLEDAGESQVSDEFIGRRDRLRSFDHIQPQPVPAGFSGELRPYQVSGLEWLHFLHEYGFGGCLADDMGLGKTIQLLAFLQSLREQGKLEGTSLLVVPKSLIANWLREAERFTPGLRFLEYIGNSRKKDAEVFKDYDVILTTYGTMLRDIDFLRKVEFLYVVLDESQNIKNPLAQSSKAARLVNARHRLVMTGTPVQNNTFELWSQFAFLNPGLLGSMDYFRHEFVTPIESKTSEKTVQLLRRLVYPFILRRTKEQVAPELPPRTERVLYIDMEPAQRKLYNHTRDYYRGKLLGMIEEEGMDDARMKILEGLLRLRQLCIHPRLMDDNYRGSSPKFDVLLETIENLHSEGHKALIFSQFVKTLHLLQVELDQRHIPYAYLDGQTVDRQAQVDLFQNDPAIPLFLISLKAGGVGLNLTSADYVIHIDPWWNPAVEMQAADRAHRIGQDKPVFIYKIIARNSVEEKILELQEHKKELVDKLIGAEGSFFKSITKEDVKALFT
jgi:non-specific serine/threonine protein kinase